MKLSELKTHINEILSTTGDFDVKMLLTYKNKTKEIDIFEVEYQKLCGNVLLKSAFGGSRSGGLIAKNDIFIKELLSDERYEIRLDGTIWTKVPAKGYVGSLLKEFREVKPFTSGGGYQVINYKTKKLLVHRIVYAKFKGELASDLVVAHFDDDKTNNSISNLELTTQTENNKHRYKNGGPAVVGYRKINHEAADEIRKLHESGLSYGKILKIIGPKYGIRAKSTISYIITNKTWNNKELILGNQPNAY